GRRSELVQPPVDLGEPRLEPDDLGAHLVAYLLQLAAQLCELAFREPLGVGLDGDPLEPALEVVERDLRGDARRFGGFDGRDRWRRRRRGERLHQRRRRDEYDSGYDSRDDACADREPDRHLPPSSSRLVSRVPPALSRTGGPARDEPGAARPLTAGRKW